MRHSDVVVKHVRRRNQVRALWRAPDDFFTGLSDQGVQRGLRKNYWILDLQSGCRSCPCRPFLSPQYSFSCVACFRVQVVARGELRWHHSFLQLSTAEISAPCIALWVENFVLDCVVKSRGPYFTIYDGDFEHYRQHARAQIGLSASTTDFLKLPVRLPFPHAAVGAEQRSFIQGCDLGDVAGTVSS